MAHNFSSMEINSGLRFTSFKTLLSLYLNRTFRIKNSARKEKCDGRA
jgi:hypothetical protein